MGEFILKDLERYPNQEIKNDALKEKMIEWIGHVVMLPGSNNQYLMNFTGPTGMATGVYYSLMFQLRKWGYNVEKMNEWIEVSPVHQQYYQITQKQKEDLENKIKQGLTSAAQAVSDLDLIEHDLRKYREFIDYFGYIYTEDKNKLIKISEFIADPKNQAAIKTAEKHGAEKGYQKLEDPDISKGGFEDTVERKKSNKLSDEHSLKAIFVDQVDFHSGSTGQGAGRLSMSFMQQQNIMPTIVQDFYAMDSEQDLEEDKELKNLPTVEKNMLRTKWRAYQEWKSLFEGEVKKRFLSINQLAKSRRKSVEEYREWLKPYITRHNMIEEGFASEGMRKSMKTSFITAEGQAISTSGVKIWAWRYYIYPEMQPTPGELLVESDPYDEWTKQHLIWNDEYGLVASYPWITEEWVDKRVKEIKKVWLKADYPYYSCFEIDFNRTTIKFPGGDELEDADFKVNMVFMSQNALLAKLLEVKAIQEQVERYINDMLGITQKSGEQPEITGKEEKTLLDKTLDFLELKFKFWRKGPYEKNFKERITKSYMKNMAAVKYVGIINFIQKKIGYGQP